MEMLLEFLKPMVEAYAGNYGVAVQVISIIGSLRLAVKPIQDLASAVVLIIPGTKDDEFVAKVFGSKVYKGIVFALDWFASIKLVK